MGIIINHYLGGGFNFFFLCSPLFGEDELILTHIFQMGWFNHQLVNCLKRETKPPRVFDQHLLVCESSPSETSKNTR